MTPTNQHEHEHQNCKAVAAATLTQMLSIFLSQTVIREDLKTPDGAAKMIEPYYRRMLQLVETPRSPMAEIGFALDEGADKIEWERNGQKVFATLRVELFEAQDDEPRLEIFQIGRHGSSVRIGVLPESKLYDLIIEKAQSNEPLQERAAY